MFDHQVSKGKGTVLSGWLTRRAAELTCAFTVRSLCITHTISMLCELLKGSWVWCPEPGSPGSLPIFFTTEPEGQVWQRDSACACNNTLSLQSQPCGYKFLESSWGMDQNVVPTRLFKVALEETKARSAQVPNAWVYISAALRKVFLKGIKLCCCLRIPRHDQFSHILYKVFSKPSSELTFSVQYIVGSGAFPELLICLCSSV